MLSKSDQNYVVIACDDDGDGGGGDNDYKAGATRGPCCDNVWGGSGAFDKILLVAIDKILGPAGEKYSRLPVKGFPFTQVRSARQCTAVNCTPTYIDTWHCTALESISV